MGLFEGFYYLVLRVFSYFYFCFGEIFSFFISGVGSVRGLGSLLLGGGFGYRYCFVWVIVVAFVVV